MWRTCGSMPPIPPDSLSPASPRASYTRRLSGSESTSYLNAQLRWMDGVKQSGAMTYAWVTSLKSSGSPPLSG